MNSSSSSSSSNSKQSPEYAEYLKKQRILDKGSHQVEVTDLTGDVEPGTGAAAPSNAVSNLSSAASKVVGKDKGGVDNNVNVEAVATVQETANISVESVTQEAANTERDNGPKNITHKVRIGRSKKINPRKPTRSIPQKKKKDVISKPRSRGEINQQRSKQGKK